MKILLAVIILGLALSAQSALPPRYQRLVEKSALEKDSMVLKLIGDGAEIDSITLVQSREKIIWKVKSNDCEILAQVVFEEQSMPGPAKFHFDIIRADNCAEPSSLDRDATILDQPDSEGKKGLEGQAAQI